MKTAIMLQCHLKNDDQGRLMRCCAHLLRHLNPDCDLLVVDNASPLDPEPYLDGIPRHHLRLADSIGHWSPSYADEMVVRRDGPGRAIMTGIFLAYSLGYDRWVYTESDSLHARPAQWIFDQMQKRVSCQPRTTYGYYDWQMWCCSDLKWLVEECRFPQRYDWANQTPEPVGETQYETLLGGDLQMIPMKGCRGETNGLDAGNIRQLFPDGIDFMTHASLGAFRQFLDMNNLSDMRQHL